VSFGEAMRPRFARQFNLRWYYHSGVSPDMTMQGIKYTTNERVRNALTI